MKISRRHQIQLFVQLHLLLSSGILIADALARLKERYPDSRTRRVLREVHSRVAESRTTLSRALGSFPRSFPASVVASIESGEEGGALLLAERFADLADRLAYEDATRRQLRRACAYPLLVVLMAGGLTLFLLGAVFPRLADLLASFGGQLPPLTVGVIRVSNFVRRAWPAFAGAPVAAAALVAVLRRFPRAALGTDRLLLRVPVIGPVYQDLAVALICKTFRSLYRANRSAPQIIDQCSRLVANRAFQIGLAESKRRIVSEGATLAEAFGRSRLFPPLACLAIDVGERTGQIAAAMDRVAEHLRADARERLSAAVALVNPALVLAVVAGVGTILASFFQAVYQVAYAAR